MWTVSGFCWARVLTQSESALSVWLPSRPMAQWWIVTGTLVTGRKRQGVCRARQHGLGDAVLVYVDYSELCIAGLISILTALFVDCLQGGRICP